MSLRFGVPQGSVVGPFLFTLYTGPISAICRRHDNDYQLYADDTQVYLNFNLTNTNDQKMALKKIEACVEEISLRIYCDHFHWQFQQLSRSVLIVLQSENPMSQLPPLLALSASFLTSHFLLMIISVNYVSQAIFGYETFTVSVAALLLTATIGWIIVMPCFQATLKDKFPLFWCNFTGCL